MAPIDCSGVAPAAGHSWFCKFCRLKHESKVRTVVKDQNRNPRTEEESTVRMGG